jgi:hypothetical protein
LVKCCLALKDKTKARNYLNRWEKDKCNDSPASRDYLIATYCSNLKRLEGQFGEALEYARQAQHIRHSFSIESVANESFVRACLCSNSLSSARDELVATFNSHRSQSSFLVYQYRLLIGDYYLTCARAEAKFSAVDEEYSNEFSDYTEITNSVYLLRLLRKAYFAYRLALKTSLEIDEKLNCTYYHDTIATRFERLATIEVQCIRHS